MKRKLLFLTMAIGLNTFAQYPYLIRDQKSLSTTNAINWSNDVQYDINSNTVFGLHSSTANGSIITRHDATGGTLLKMLSLYSSSYSSPVKILADNQNFYVLLNVNVGTANQITIASINSSTYVLNYIKAYNTTDNTASDFTLDGAGNCYVVGSNSGSNIETIVFKMNLSTGNIIWQSIYRNPYYDESPSSIVYAGVNQIFVAGVSVSQTSILDRGNYILKLADPGTIVNAAWYKYSTCTSIREGSPNLLFDNSDELIMSSTSYVGHDGNGPMYLMKVNMSTLAIINQKHYDTGAAYLNSEMTKVVTTTGNKLLLSGNAPAMNTATPGYEHVFFDKATLNFLTGTLYTSTTPNNFSASIYDTYTGNTSGKNIFSIAKNALTGNSYYLLKSDVNGFTGCNTSISLSANTCALTQNTIPFTVKSLTGLMNNLTGFTLGALKSSTTDLCYLPCPTCPSPAIEMAQPGLNDHDVLNNCSVFPNPSKGKFTVSIHGEDQIRTIKIYSITGELIKEITVDSDLNHIEINCEELKEGTYLIEVITPTTSYFEKVLRD